MNMATAPTEQRIAEAIDVQQLIAKRQQLIAQQREIEQALSAQEEQRAQIVEALRKQDRDKYAALGLQPGDVWYDLAKPRAEASPGQTAANLPASQAQTPGQVRKRNPKGRPSVWNYCDINDPIGSPTRGFAGKPPEWAWKSTEDKTRDPAKVRDTTSQEKEAMLKAQEVWDAAHPKV
ncbi:hypothetical protein ACQUZK_09175 [Streptococcus pyogenes]|uniref:hypothetical protein n=1 Tax=Streptococcus pyogenes TaxID=1314 RepID=UPI003DA1BCEF